MKNFVKIIVICSAISLYGCKKEKSDDAYFDVSSSNRLSFWQEGGTRFVTVNTNRDFSVESSQTWCTPEILTTTRDNLQIVVSPNDVVGKEREAEITVSSEGFDDYLIIVSQLAEEPFITVKETSIGINEREQLDFTLDVTANIFVSFDLPDWISEKENNVPVTGLKTYSFVASVLPEGTDRRTENITVKASAATGFDINIEIPVNQTKSTILRVATYNVWVETAMWNYSLYRRRNLLNDLIRKYDFEIFGSQEGLLNPHLNDITADGVYTYTGRGRDDGFSGGEHSAIIYKKDRFDLLDAGDFWYSETPTVPSYGWGAEYRRICSWGKFRDKNTGREFYFFSSHFDHQVAIAREESAKLMLQKIKEIAGDYPVFTVGDFNATPFTNPIQLILNDGMFRDAFNISETPRKGSSGTFNGATNDNPTSRIDYIFVTNEIRVLEYEVINDRGTNPLFTGQRRFPSDHDPVFVIVEF